MLRLSVLDLAPITQGSTAATALRHARDLANKPSGSALPRYWLAEHHNMPGIASAATAVVIAHVAAGTRTIRVGAGGIMLPNHAPLVVAEQFGTLESLFPGRIDLGLGRAPGTDPATARALRRTLQSDPDAFPQDVVELMAYFAPTDGQTVQRGSGRGLAGPDLHPGIEPVWCARGGRTWPALRLRVTLRAGGDDAGHRDLPLEFPAVRGARAAVPDAWHQRHRGGDRRGGAISRDVRPRAFANLRRGMPTTLPPPNRDFEKDVVPFGRVPLEEVTSISMVGAPPTVHDGIRRFAGQTAADELIVVSHIYDYGARVRSYEIVSELIDQS